jgi:hypothetical protein
MVQGKWPEVWAHRKRRAEQAPPLQEDARIFFVGGPSHWVFVNVTAEVIEALARADYVFVIVALPEELTRRHADFIHSDGGD